jgi:hypothetical protein
MSTITVDIENKFHIGQSVTIRTIDGHAGNYKITHCAPHQFSAESLASRKTRRAIEAFDRKRRRIAARKTAAANHARDAEVEVDGQANAPA